MNTRSNLRISGTDGGQSGGALHIERPRGYAFRQFAVKRAESREVSAGADRIAADNRIDMRAIGIIPQLCHYGRCQFFRGCITKTAAGNANRRPAAVDKINFAHITLESLRQ